MADVAGLGSSVDSAGWRGVGKALQEMSSCSHADLALPTRPSDYRRMLQAYVGYDLVVAASFLLTDAVVDVARANPATHFMLIDPIVRPPEVANLAVLTFRSDESAFLAGVLAGTVTRTGVVAGVYGPEGAIDRSNRTGFEHGARYVRPTVQVLGAYQPAQDGQPYGNPGWGADQARAFSGQQADVIFGAGGTTGEGALRGAAQSGRACIGVRVDVDADPGSASVPGSASGPGAGCLLASAATHVAPSVAMTVIDVAGGRWHGGWRALGLADHAVGLSLYASLPSGVQQQILNIADLLVSGALTTGA